PSTPSGGSFNGTNETMPTGWSDAPVYVNGQITYASRAIYTQNPNTGAWSHSGWSVPKAHVVKGDKGDKGDPGQSVTVTETSPGVYTITGANGSVVVRDGQNAPVPELYDFGNGNYAMTVDGETIEWHDGEAGQDGQDGYTPQLGVDYFYNGRFYSVIYKAALSQPSTPSGGGFNGTNETMPTGWSDAPVYVNGQITYASRAIYTQNPNTGVWSHSGWSVPKAHVV
ncbi:hypothetical protein, partial [Catenovulum sediminis]